jgi:hypothetical protein
MELIQVQVLALPRILLIASTNTALRKIHLKTTFNNKNLRKKLVTKKNFVKKF